MVSSIEGDAQMAKMLICAGRNRVVPKFEWIMPWPFVWTPIRNDKIVETEVHRCRFSEDLSADEE